MTDRPHVIGLTGSIGMGKTTTAALFSQAGVPVWDADAAVARLYAEDTDLIAAIAGLCPTALRNGQVDKQGLKDWIATEPTALKRLEALVHPAVAADRARFIAGSDAEVVLLDIPLLFETGADAIVDTVVVVSTDPETQRRRVLERPGMTAERFEYLLAAQMPDAEKRQRADFIVRSDDLATARLDVETVLSALGGKHA